MVRLASDLRGRIYWLRSVPAHRLMPSLHRFAVAGWTATDVQTALDQLLAVRGWHVPGNRTPHQHRHTHRVDHHGQPPTPAVAPPPPLRSPYGYLAMLLRALEPTDLIQEREHEHASAQAQRHYAHQLTDGAPCPHGQPAGHILSPTRGIQACPACRGKQR